MDSPKGLRTLSSVARNGMDLVRRKQLGLSPREAEALELAADGLTDKEVAQRLQVSQATIRTFWDRIRKKLGASNRAQAIARALAPSYAPKAERVPTSGLSALMENEGLGVSIIEVGGAILDANDAFLHIIGYTREDLEAGKIRWDKITAPEYEQRDRLASKELFKRGMITPYEKEYITKSGARVRVRRGSALLGTSDRAVSYILALSAPSESPQAQHVHRFASLL